MPNDKSAFVILMADDDEDDCLATKKALQKSHLSNVLFFVHDGEELMDYLNRRGDYSDPARSPRPSIILLDLNMPKKDGREALKEIKEDPNLHHIAVIVLTTSSQEEDIYRSYNIGANAFITKPVTFSGLVDVMKAIGKFWFEIVEFPDDNRI